MKNEGATIVDPYPRSDARRLFVLLAAIDRLERPTLTSLSAATGHNKGTIDADVLRLSEQYGIDIAKEDAVYRIVSWGDLLKKDGVRRYFPM